MDTRLRPNLPGHVQAEATDGHQPFCGAPGNLPILFEEVAAGLTGQPITPGQELRPLRPESQPIGYPRTASCVHFLWEDSRALPSRCSYPMPPPVGWHGHYLLTTRDCSACASYT